MLDIRVDVNLPEHPKFLDLERTLGAAGCWSALRLWLYARQHRHEGILYGLSYDDIERVAGWKGEKGALIKALLHVPKGESGGLLDVDENGTFSLHGWERRQTWAMQQDARSRAASIGGRASAKARANHTKNDRSAPRSNGEATTRSTIAGTPSPSPSPSPTPSESGREGEEGGALALPPQAAASGAERAEPEGRTLRWMPSEAEQREAAEGHAAYDKAVGNGYTGSRRAWALLKPEERAAWKPAG